MLTLTLWQKIGLVFFFVVPCIIAFGQTAEEHIIDIQLKECLDSTENQTTVGMVHCARRAGDSWDKELNKYYKLLMNLLTAEEKELLKISQKNWFSYRDGEYLFAQTVYTNLEGTMWRIVFAERQAEITRQRALELKAYYEYQPGAK